MKAIVLVSGGLDSLLAALLVRKLGIEVVAVRFHMPFSERKQKKGSIPFDLKQVFVFHDIEFRSIDISDDFLRMLAQPEHGYGSQVNPCIDCKILMLRKARELMPETAASFVVTGEVLAQRPMSQHRRALKVIEEQSGLQGLLLRPLCAKHLEPTIPEQEGWIDRSQLLGFNGRTRRPQMDLAAQWGITRYQAPAGGCLLTETYFVSKVRDLLKYNELTVANAQCLTVGRHFRLSDTAKLIVGRDEQENEKLERIAAPDDYICMPTIISGPTVLGKGVFDNTLIQRVCELACAYCDVDESRSAEFTCYKADQTTRTTIHATVMPQQELERLRI